MGRAMIHWPHAYTTAVDQLFVLFSLFIIGSVYFLPLCFIGLNKAHLSTINTFINQYPSHLIVLCGDYNFPHIFWSNYTYGLCYSSPSISQYLCSWNFLSTWFFQLNNFSNSNLLDLVFTNCKSISVNSAVKSAVPSDSFHAALSLSLYCALPPLAFSAPLPF